MSILFKVGTDQQLDKPIVRTCGDQALRARPINAIDGAYMVVLLLQDDVNLLDRLTCIVMDASARIDLILINVIISLTV